MEASDAELLEAWRRGDEDSGNALVERHFRLVYRFFRSKVDRGVDDLTQRTFLACVESKRLGEVESFRAYLLGIARKQLLMHLRAGYRRDAVFDPEATSMREAVPGDLVSPSGFVVERDAEKLLLAALRRIPIDFQIAVELFYWQDLPLSEIASVLEVATGTVKSRLGRAREMLRTHIEELAGNEDLRKATVDDVDRWARSLHGKFQLGDS